MKKPFLWFYAKFSGRIQPQPLLTRNQASIFDLCFTYIHTLHVNDSLLTYIVTMVIVYYIFIFYICWLQECSICCIYYILCIICKAGIILKYVYRVFRKTMKIFLGQIVHKNKAKNQLGYLVFLPKNTQRQRFIFVNKKTIIYLQNV